jgi:hypothetical protein
MFAARMREPSAGVLARTFEDAKRWVIRRTTTSRHISYARVDRIIIDADAVLNAEGASILGYSWRPKSSVDLVRVKVVVPAWSNQPNSIVAAFRCREQGKIKM